MTTTVKSRPQDHAPIHRPHPCLHNHAPSTGSPPVTDRASPHGYASIRRIAAPSTDHAPPTGSRPTHHAPIHRSHPHDHAPVRRITPHPQDQDPAHRSQPSHIMPRPQDHAPIHRPRPVRRITPLPHELVSPAPGQNCGPLLLYLLVCPPGLADPRGPPSRTRGSWRRKGAPPAHHALTLQAGGAGPPRPPHPRRPVR